MPELVKCFHCGESYPIQEMSERKTSSAYDQFPESEKYYCEDCYPEIITCDFCLREFHKSTMEDDHINCACSECMEESVIYCSECEQLVMIDDTEEWMNEKVCYTCMENIRQNLKYISPYEYKPVPNFHSLPNEINEPFFGWELEIDRKESISKEELEKHAEYIHDAANSAEMSDYEKYCYLKFDGSIKNGMEVISHPATFNFHMQEMKISEILYEAEQLGYSSHDVGTCGLHIHISRSAFGTRPGEEELNIAKLLLFFETNWNNIVKFSRRSQKSITDYCNRYGLKEGEKPRELLEKAKQFGRFFAVNLKNEKTVEIRIFRGTLKLETFTACLQFTHLITELVSSLKVQQVLDLTWTDLIQIASEKGYNEFVNYSKSKNLQ